MPCRNSVLEPARVARGCTHHSFGFTESRAGANWRRSGLFVAGERFKVTQEALEVAAEGLHLVHIEASQHIFLAC